MLSHIAKGTIKPASQPPPPPAENAHFHFFGKLSFGGLDFGPVSWQHLSKIKSFFKKYSCDKKETF
jgi:hypothetical protein